MQVCALGACGPSGGLTVPRLPNPRPVNHFTTLLVRCTEISRGFPSRCHSVMRPDQAEGPELRRAPGSAGADL